MDGDLDTDRRACFCNRCNGQLVARRTFYEHKKRHAFVEDVCGGEKPLIDPFDADISSSEDDLDGPSVKGDLDKALGEIVESKDICSKPGDGIPPLKVSRLTSEESIQNTPMLDSGSDHDDIELIPPCTESDPLDAVSTVSDNSSSGEDALVDDIFDDWEVPEAANNIENDTTSGSGILLVKSFIYMLFKWYVKYRISDRAMDWLLKLLYSFFLILGKQTLWYELNIHFPKNLSALRSAVHFSTRDFTQYAVCPNPNCTKLYALSDIFALDGTNQPTAVSCTSCGSQLAKEKILADGKKKTFHPLKVYCYKSILKSLEIILSRPKYYQACCEWKTRKIPMNGVADIFDGKVWKEFSSSHSSDDDKLSLGLMINCDWFQPFKRRSNISVGVLYAVIVNLPWSSRFKPENVILIGIIPALKKEPVSLNTFLQPAIKEFLTLQKGIKFKVDGNSVTVMGQIICTSNDIPATRKLVGFLGHSAILGCSKCLKRFETMTVGGVRRRNYAGFQREDWELRTGDTHRLAVSKITTAKTKATKQKLEKEFGCRYSALLQLDYFDPIIHHVIDPMHNLFLGTAKKMFKLWIERNLLSFAALKEIDKRISSLQIPYEIGRVPTGISSNFGNFTAAEWKNWTVVYSLYCLQGVLPVQHLVCWQTFVLACRILCQPVLFPTDITKADQLLLKFCRTVEVLYGAGSITPNMHLHCHLKDCIQQYGPISSFWLFSFERYNGLLGSFSNNRRNIEAQLMYKFLSIHHSHSIQPLTDINSESDMLPSLPDLSCCTYEDSADFSTVSVDTYMAPFLALRSVSWVSCDIRLPKKSAHVSFDKEDIVMISSIYSILFPDISFQSLPLICKKYPYIHIGSQCFGSKLCCKTRARSSCIMASWANVDGTINTSSYLPRPGIIQYFLHHTFAAEGPSESQNIEITFAVVKWYDTTSEDNKTFRPPLIEFSDTSSVIPSGPAVFLPVLRIARPLAVAVNHSSNHQTAKVAVPLLNGNYLD